MAFVEETAAYMTDFAVDATVGSVSVRGIFDNPYDNPLGLVAGSSPALLIPSSSAPSAAVGTSVTIGAASYTVVAIEPDGVGLTRLVLKA